MRVAVLEPTGERPGAPRKSLLACSVLALGLAFLTAGIAVYYAGEEPFPRLRYLKYNGEEEYEVLGYAYTFVYVGIGGLTVVGWALLSAYLLRRMIRGPRSIAAAALLAVSLPATWFSTSTPLAWLEDKELIDRMPPPGFTNYTQTPHQEPSQ